MLGSIPQVCPWTGHSRACLPRGNNGRGSGREVGLRLSWGSSLPWLGYYGNYLIGTLREASLRTILLISCSLLSSASLSPYLCYHLIKCAFVSACPWEPAPRKLSKADLGGTLWSQRPAPSFYRRRKS